MLHHASQPVPPNFRDLVQSSVTRRAQLMDEIKARSAALGLHK